MHCIVVPLAFRVRRLRDGLKSRNHPHRETEIEETSQFIPFKSLLEKIKSAMFENTK